jgi:UrcA family protein
MKTNIFALLVGILATGIGSMASAQNPEVIIVTTKPVPTTKLVNKPMGGVEGTPIVDISLSYGVSTAGLDLATASGAKALEQRIRDAADAVCKEIGRQYPHSWPSDKECAQAAADRGMVKARELIQAAEKAAGQKHSG